MCFDDGETYTSKTYIRNGQQYYYESPGYRSSWRRRLGLGGSYYPSRYYARPPAGHYISSARVGLGQYPRGVVPGGYARGVVPGGYSQALVPAGYARGMVHGSYPQGVTPGGYANGGQSLHGARVTVPGGAAMRTYYNTTPSYGYQAHVYPPGATTTTTTYHVTNSHAQSPYVASPVVRTACTQTPAREDIQMENRRVATERGAYAPRRIRPADARHDDPFWCRERNGEWHLRTFYQIENECHPGRWLMDAEVGFLVFHRD